ncbi:ficolin-2-like [Oculina patagonica]
MFSSSQNCCLMELSSFCGYVNIAHKIVQHSGNMKKRLAPNPVTQTPCYTKDESHPLFHQSVTQLTTVKLGFDQIRTMTCVSLGFRCSLLFLVLFVMSQTLAKPGNSANSTPVSSTATKRCNNVYNSFYAGPNKKIKTILQEMKKQLTQVQDDINILKGNRSSLKAKKNCAELYKSGQKISGVYTIDPDSSGAFDVFCDQTTAGGGWTVFQKRLDGSVNFYRGWADYKRGFGNLNGEFWLGLDKINRLTKTKNRLRVDLEDTTGKTAYAEYDMFAVTSERTKYQLSLGSYSGTAGDSLSYHRGQPFSTKDQDNDSSSSNSCAVYYKGAWWYKSCHESNLNGLYHHGKHSSVADGVNWYHWKGYHYSAKRAEMKIRPVHF